MGAERLTLLALLALLAAGCQGSPGGGTTTTTTSPAAAVVEWVNDGDTLTLTNGDKVRLLQIDAPELTTDCFGRAALQYLIRLAPRGTRVSLVSDAGLDDHDRYGRLLRYVLVGGENVNVTLVREGAASPYFFRGDRGIYARQLLDAANEAREARRGYWGACPGAELNTGVGSLTGRR